MKRGQSVGGAFLDLKLLARDKARVLVFRPTEFMAAEPGKYGPSVPVIADVLICDGDEIGEVHLGEKFIGAATGPLRGVKNPKKGERVPDPVNVLGEELVFRVTVKDDGVNQAFVALDEPSDAEYAQAEKVFAKVGWNGRPSAPAQKELAPTGTDGAAPAAKSSPVSAVPDAPADDDEKMPWE